MFTMILLQIVMVSPGTHLVNKESKLKVPWWNEVDVNCGNTNLNEEMIIAIVINSNLNHGDDHMFI